MLRDSRSGCAAGTDGGEVMTVLIALASAAAGFALALKLVGYGVSGGLKQIVRLWKYTHGRCKCSMCR